jgi:hypothetical protein
MGKQAICKGKLTADKQKRQNKRQAGQVTKRSASLRHAGRATNKETFNNFWNGSQANK